ncbi:MAG TPA: DUF4352 domain-containing protein [Clostridia bacterium]|nr:DUF4352 domain-containing protein [Clostridia bacterium]
MTTPPPPQKKKFYTRVWFWLLVAVVVLFGGCSAIVFGTAKAVTDATNHLNPNNDTTSGGAPTNNPGCTKNPPSYPDQQRTHDCVALPDGSVSVANVTVTATGWARSQDSIGVSSICAAVTVKNNNTSTISYSEFNFKLQSPTGTVTDATITLSNSLGSGDLVAGGNAAGQVCFQDPGQPGTYVGIYKPNPFSASRGIWLGEPAGI